MTTQHKKMAILVAGGPAPGINSVISAATIRGELEGVDVIGIRDGFEWIMQGNIDYVTPLTIENVSRIHFRGGSCIGISRVTSYAINDPISFNSRRKLVVLVSFLRRSVSLCCTSGWSMT